MSFRLAEKDLDLYMYHARELLSPVWCTFLFIARSSQIFGVVHSLRYLEELVLLISVSQWKVNDELYFVSVNAQLYMLCG